MIFSSLCEGSTAGDSLNKNVCHSHRLLWETHRITASSAGISRVLSKKEPEERYIFLT